MTEKRGGDREREKSGCGSEEIGRGE